MDVVWSSNLEGVPHGMQTRNPEELLAFGELREKQAQLNRWFQQYASSLTAEEMDESIEFTFIGGGAGVMKKQDVLLHVVNHASYHRGHIEGVMYQMHIEPPTTDLPVFLKSDNI